eukprot:8058535-Prorocentrum_lima.AAC.1
MVQRLVAYYSSTDARASKRLRDTRHQMKHDATTLQRLVKQIFNEAVQTRCQPKFSTAHIPGDALLVR